MHQINCLSLDWTKINDHLGGTYNTNSDITKTTILMPSLCNYSDAYILVKGRITITRAGDDAATR